MKLSQLKQIIKEEVQKQAGMKIYTVIVFMSGGYDIDWNDVKSFTSFGAAESYAESLGRTYDIIPNELG